ncbi:uncharacterized protein LOC123540924 [Mercenaria mercenaria]|uniref:uncharacterized protein LOC123540924 n=1 Tax=Mercenaria mercenaria TaxID=6596 RepID=UPI00234EEC5C|nr:uncharacterized protein LOC123540924 [Mercenaria mercenaria]
MKVLIAAILIAFVVYVSGEHCSTNDDCHNHGITTCGGSHAVVCQHHAFFGNQCECTDGGAGGQACTVKDTCPDCNQLFQEKHCVDGTCHCTINIGGIIQSK